MFSTGEVVLSVLHTKVLEWGTSDARFDIIKADQGPVLIWRNPDHDNVNLQLQLSIGSRVNLNMAISHDSWSTSSCGSPVTPDHDGVDADDRCWHAIRSSPHVHTQNRSTAINVAPIPSTYTSVILTYTVMGWASLSPEPKTPSLQVATACTPLVILWIGL